MSDIIDIEPAVTATALAATPSTTPAALLQIAVQQGADIDKLERLMALQERWEAAEAKKAFNCAFAAFKSEAVRLIKNKEVKDGPLKSKTYAELHAVVTAVNQDWGFLVIGAGSNSGFTPQSSLIVQRNGRRVGRVRPSSIEPTQTIAEIDLDSLATGVRIQPGDRVILATPTSN